MFKMIKVVLAIIYLYTITSLAHPATDLNDWSVIGGNVAAPGQFPFIISLREPQNVHICGGAIIDQNWIITAAQCVTEYIAMGYTVVAGTNLLSSDQNKVRVSKIVIHPDFNPQLFTNDIALLRLVTPLSFSHFIKPIDLPCERIEEVENCTIAGWGRTKVSSEEYSNNLQFVNVDTLPLEECRTTWSLAEKSFPILDNEICTDTKTGKGPCYGDAGGPLFVKNNGQTRLIGISSWGSPCAEGWPDVYTRVSSFCSWIQSYIQN